MDNITHIDKGKKNEQRERDLKDALFHVLTGLDILFDDICKEMHKAEARLQIMHDDFLDKINYTSQALFEIYQKYPELKHEKIQMKTLPGDEE